MKRRRWLAVALLVAALPLSWLHERRGPADLSQRIAVTPLPVPPGVVAAPHLGPFHLEGVWQMASGNPMFGGYSTLQRLNDGRFLAISDRGYALYFSPPGEPRTPVRMVDLVKSEVRQKNERDAESSAYDPATGRLWIGWEASNAISRLGPDLHREARARPAAMRDWPLNTGAEAMLRLPGGRFLVLAEGTTGWFEEREHTALLFPGDPAGGAVPERLRISVAPRFSVTDMARLPDGHVLILLRCLVWPFPIRFAGRIAIADPAEIRAGGVWHARTVAYLSTSLPVDNFEGIAAEPLPDGTVAVWLISDDNLAVTQRTLLWKMTVDPKDLH